MFFRDSVEWVRALRVVRARSFLLLFTVLGACQVAPVYTKRSVAPLYAIKHHDFGTFSFKILSGALGASGWLLDAFWVPLGCLLGASWVPPGCLLGASWTRLPPGCLLGVSWVPPGCFLHRAYPEARSHMCITASTSQMIPVSRTEHAEASLNRTEHAEASLIVVRAPLPRPLPAEGGGG